MIFHKITTILTKIHEMIQLHSNADVVAFIASACKVCSSSQAVVVVVDLDIIVAVVIIAIVNIVATIFDNFVVIFVDDIVVVVVIVIFKCQSVYFVVVPDLFF